MPTSMNVIPSSSSRKIIFRFISNTSGPGITEYEPRRHRSGRLDRPGGARLPHRRTAGTTPLIAGPGGFGPTPTKPCLAPPVCLALRPTGPGRGLSTHGPEFMRTPSLAVPPILALGLSSAKRSPGRRVAKKGLGARLGCESACLGSEEKATISRQLIALLWSGVLTPDSESLYRCARPPQR